MPPAWQLSLIDVGLRNAVAVASMPQRIKDAHGASHVQRCLMLIRLRTAGRHDLIQPVPLRSLPLPEPHCQLQWDAALALP